MSIRNQFQSPNPMDFTGGGASPGEQADDFTDELASLASAFGEAKVEQSGGSVPDGKYQARIERVFLARGQSSGRLQLKWEMSIVGPSHVGAKLWRQNMVEPEKMGWLKGDLDRFGVKLGSIAELKTVGNILAGRVAEVTCRTKGEFQNVYLNAEVKVPGAGGNSFGQAGGIPAGGGFDPSPAAQPKVAAGEIGDTPF